jgi:ABC-type transporter Mla MlaB component
LSKAHEGHRKLRNTGRALAVVGAGIVAARIASARRAPVDEQPDEPQPAPWAELAPVAPGSPAKTVQPVDTPRADRSWESLRAPLLVSLAIILAATAVWFVEFHQRVDAATVQNAVALKNPGTTVGCVATSANGSQWECAVVRRADSNCVSLSASVLGRVSVGRRPICLRAIQQWVVAMGLRPLDGVADAMRDGEGRAVDADASQGRAQAVQHDPVSTAGRHRVTCGGCGIAVAVVG